MASAEDGDASAVLRNLDAGPKGDCGAPCAYAPRKGNPAASAEKDEVGDDTRHGAEEEDILLEVDVKAGAASAVGVGVKRDTGGGYKRQTQQPAQLSERAISAYERTVLEDGSFVGNVGNQGQEKMGGEASGEAATRRLKVMSFLQDLAATEAEERDRSFKASCGESRREGLAALGVGACDAETPCSLPL